MNLIHDALTQYGYAAVFVLVFGAAAYAPLPLAVVIVIAGALMARGYFIFDVVLPVIVAAAVMGDMLAYALTRRLTARAAWESRCKAHPSLGRLETYLKARPTLTVIGSRFVPFVAGGVNSLAGMSRLSPVRFGIADLLGNVLYALTYLFLGLAFGRAWGDAVRVASIGGGIAFAVCALTIVGWLVLRRHEPVGAPAE